MIIQPRKKKIKKRRKFNLLAVIHLAVKANQSLLVFHKQIKRINQNNIKGKRLKKIMKNHLKTKKMFHQRIVIQILDPIMESLLLKKL